MRRRPATNPVSLFPFLAVLLCAMGALILLLVVLTRQIREEATRSTVLITEPEPVAAPPVEVEPPETIDRIVITIPAPAPLPPPPDPNVALRQKLARLEQDRAAAQRDLEHQQNVSAQQEREIAAAAQRLQNERVALEASQARLAARRLALQQKESEKATLLASLQLARGSLAAALEAAAAAEPRVSIVPYDGRSGTVRRPILIECSGEAIRFIPEDVSLSASDLEGFLPDYNPLLAGAIALRKHWAEVDGLNQPSAYVLLLVHDDGVAAYYAARTLLRSLDTETGYELVTEEMQLAAPPLDPDAAEACRKAVLETLQHRQALLAEMNRRGIENKTTFPTGRFEVDPREHDPTREKDSIWSASGSTETPPPTPQRDNGGRGQSQSRRAPALSPMTPLEAAGVSAGSLGRQVAESARTRRVEQDARRLAEDDRALHEAMAESWPSFSNQNGGKRQWGTSSPTANISLERPVSLDVRSQQIIVGTQIAIPIGPAGLTGETARSIVEAVQREADGWGRAPGDFYWTPRLQASLHPGMTLQFDRIKPALNAAGLQVSTRIVLDPTESDFLELTHATSASQ